jgi:hypothetical protein
VRRCQHDLHHIPGVPFYPVLHCVFLSPQVDLVTADALSELVSWGVVREVTPGRYQAIPLDQAVAAARTQALRILGGSLQQQEQVSPGFASYTPNQHLQGVEVSPPPPAAAAAGYESNGKLYALPPKALRQAGCMSSIGCFGASNRSSSRSRSSSRRSAGGVVRLRPHLAAAGAVRRAPLRCDQPGTMARGCCALRC